MTFLDQPVIVAVSRKIEAIEKVEAKSRMSEGGRKGKRNKGGEMCPTLKRRDESKRSKSIAVVGVGMSRLQVGPHLPRQFHEALVLVRPVDDLGFARRLVAGVERSRAGWVSGVRWVLGWI